MDSRGVTALADIARVLKTSPQAVSNWKARDQVPYHVVAKLNQSAPSDTHPPFSDQPYSSPVTRHSLTSVFEENTISFSDILLTMSEQLKVILMVPFITVFLTFTYVQFIQQPYYLSSSKRMLIHKRLLEISKNGTCDALPLIRSILGSTAHWNS